MLGRRFGDKVGPYRKANRSTELGKALEQTKRDLRLTFQELATRWHISRRTLLTLANSPDEYAGYRSRYAVIEKIRQEYHSLKRKPPI